MPNIASLLKSEITRLARKETKGATGALKRAVNAHRSEIAALKRRLVELEKALRRSNRVASTPRDAAAQIDNGSNDKLRFSAKGFAKHRRRLGLSANDIGLLMGISGQTVYNWETGAARPRASHMPAIAALRKLGKRQAEAVLAQRRGAG